MDLSQTWRWYDAEPSLRCAVITGQGKAFCAGADLKEWNAKNLSGKASRDVDGASWLENGFRGMSNRRGKEPIIAAVNGHCFGGGFEMVLNSDCAIASESARFGLPEVSLGLAAVAGALPRLIRAVGRQRASEITLLGRTYTTQQLCGWGVVNKVVPEGSALSEALQWAAEIGDKSPDAIVLTRAGLLGGLDGEDPTSSTRKINNSIFKAVDRGVNMKEGVLGFVEKRSPVWIDSKL